MHTQKHRRRRSGYYPKKKKKNIQWKYIDNKTHTYNDDDDNDLIKKTTLSIKKYPQVQVQG